MSWRKHRNKQKASSVRNIGVVGRGEGGDDFVSDYSRSGTWTYHESLISSWSEVSTLCNQLKMHTLDLSYYNLLPLKTLATTDKQMNTLKHLVVGHIFYKDFNWKDILTLASFMPSLSVLQIHNNSLFSSLAELDLDGTNLSSCPSYHS